MRSVITFGGGGGGNSSAIGQGVSKFHTPVNQRLPWCCVVVLNSITRSVDTSLFLVIISATHASIIPADFEWQVGAESCNKFYLFYWGILVIDI